jgi:hypothetical protein
MWAALHSCPQCLSVFALSFWQGKVVHFRIQSFVVISLLKVSTSYKQALDWRQDKEKIQTIEYKYNKNEHSTIVRPKVSGQKKNYPISK